MSKWGKIHDSWLSKAINEKSCKSWQELVDAFNLSFPDYTNPPNEDVLAFRWQVSNGWRRLDIGAIYKDPFTIDKIARPVTVPPEPVTVPPEPVTVPARPGTAPAQPISVSAQPVTVSAQITNRAYLMWSKEEDEWLLDIAGKVLQARPNPCAREETQKGYGWLRGRSFSWGIIAAEYRAKFQSERTVRGIKNRLLRLTDKATEHRRATSRRGRPRRGSVKERYGEKSNGSKDIQNEENGENEDDGDNYGGDYGENYEESDGEDEWDG
ncbi:hypothetical protein P167DRAFT_546399 [Morchella conica CCBAS932]|uniref:Uncharacterized protein n=1 Tax=Morchella conica CCBAS932 TaxID=1392247 RepID=A0A3N4KPH5_9PEZI|nr:hypothetical protein P167DRAFT_546399 [Morchella conica CCBAS932]